MDINAEAENKKLQGDIITRDLLTNSSSQPIYLTSIETFGGELFSQDFFNKLLNPLIQTSDLTFKQLIERINLSYNQLKSIGIFESMRFNLEHDYTADTPSIKNYNTDNFISTKLKILLKPTNLNIGEFLVNLNNENPLNLSLTYLNKNFNGNGEAFNALVDYIPYSPYQHLKTKFHLVTNLANPNFKWLFKFDNIQMNHQAWQKSSEKAFGGLMGIKYCYLNNLEILLGVSLMKRSLYDINDAALDDVKWFGGDYIKSSVVNQLTYKSLSYLNPRNKNFPISGYNFSIANQINSNQENFHTKEIKQQGNFFIKTTVNSTFYQSMLSNYVTLKVSQNLGIIYNPANLPIHTSERFYLGGYDSFKGYLKNSINPNGANQFFKVDCYLYSKVPRFIYSPPSPEENPLRIYSNFLVGSVSNHTFNANNVATSVGFGLKYFNNVANFDIGYYFGGNGDSLQFSFSIGGSNRI